MQHNNGSHIKLITSVYPKYDWLPWRFLNTPQNYWTDIQNQRKCLDYLAKEMGVKEMNDWYKVSLKVNNK